MNRNTLAVIGGGVLTAIATSVLFVVPVLAPLETIKLFVFERTGEWWFGNPFTQLRLFGGIPGSLVAGYLARDYWGNNEWGTAMKYGLYAAFFGLALVYGIVVAYNVAHSMLVSGIFPPPIYAITVVPLIYSFPLFPAYLVEGVLGGFVGNSISRVRHGARATPTENQ